MNICACSIALASAARKLIAISLTGLLISPVFAQEATTLPAPNILFEGTPVKLKLEKTLSSATAHAGDQIDFLVVEDVSVNGVVVISKDSHAIGTVTEVEPKRRLGRAGKLDITLDSVRLIDRDRDKINLRAQAGGKGQDHTGAMIGAMAATALFTFGGSALWLLMHGKDITIPQGTPVTAFVYGDTKLDMSKFAMPSALPATITPAALVVPATSVPAAN